MTMRRNIAAEKRKIMEELKEKEAEEEKIQKEIYQNERDGEVTDEINTTELRSQDEVSLILHSELRLKTDS
jgi:hypothetical protein